MPLIGASLWKGGRPFAETRERCPRRAPTAPGARPLPRRRLAAVTRPGTGREAAVASEDVEDDGETKEEAIVVFMWCPVGATSQLSLVSKNRAVFAARRCEDASPVPMCVHLEDACGMRTSGALGLRRGTRSLGLTRRILQRASDEG